MAMVRLLIRRPTRYWCRPRHLQHRQRHSDIENIVGTDLNDTLVGYAGANIIEAGAGRIPSQGVVVAIPLYMERQLCGDTITDFGGNDIFQISASGFGGGLEEGVPCEHSTTGVFVMMPIQFPRVLVPTSCTTLVQVSSALTVMALA